MRESLLNFFVLFFSHAAPVIIFIIIPGSFASVCGPAQQSILRLFYSPAGPKVYPKSTSPNIPSLSFLPLFPALPHSLAPARSGCLTTLGDGDQAITVTREITNLTSDQICWQSERPRILKWGAGIVRVACVRDATISYLDTIFDGIRYFLQHVVNKYAKSHTVKRRACAHTRTHESSVPR